jgi:hypothetical protein
MSRWLQEQIREAGSDEPDTKGVFEFVQRRD